MSGSSFLHLVWVSIILIAFFPSCGKVNVERETITDTIKIYDTLKTTELDRPINLRASKGGFGTKVQVTWTPMPLAEKYQLYKFNDLANQYVMYKELTDTLFEDLVIPKALTKTFYKVRIYNSEDAYSRFSDADYGYTSGLNYYKAFTFGSEGYAAGQFKFTMHVETDKSGNIYISDEDAGRVQKFDRDGKYEDLFFTGKGARSIGFLDNGNTVLTQTQSSYVSVVNPAKEVISHWGTYGSGDLQFGNIEELTVDDEQNIYIVDGINHRIKKYDAAGNLLLKFGSFGTAPGQFDAPFGIAFHKNKIFVTSPRNKIIQVFDKSGKYLKSWNAGTNSFAIKSRGEHLYLACGSYIMKTDENGEVRELIGQGQFASYSQVVGVALGANDDIIVLDVYARQVLIFKKG